MTITQEKNHDTLTLTLLGRLDTTMAPQLEAALRQSLGDAKHLVLDMTDIVYVSSAGLRVLLAAQKVMNKQGDMLLRHVQGPVKEVFDITGFTDILTIE